jgi:hypothetical protein
MEGLIGLSLAVLFWIIGAVAFLVAFVFAVWFMVRVARDLRRIADSFEIFEVQSRSRRTDKLIPMPQPEPPSDPMPAGVIGSAFGR